MPKSKLRTLYIVILIIMVIVEVCTLLFDPSNTKLLLKGASTIIIYILAITGVYRRHTLLDEKRYASQYRDIIGDVFTNDRSSRKKLMKAISLYNDNHYDAAVKALDALRTSCTSGRETAALLMFRALCFSERGMHPEAIETYEELLKYDPNNSRAWSNMGLNYAKSGRTDLAENAYRNAIRAGDKNAYAYTNLASLLLDKNEPQEALDNVLTALSINAQLEPALGIAAQAYARLGEKEKAEEYLKQFGRMGGDKKALAAMLAEED